MNFHYNDFFATIFFTIYKNVSRRPNIDAARSLRMREEEKDNSFKKYSVFLVR